MFRVLNAVTFETFAAEQVAHGEDEELLIVRN